MLKFYEKFLRLSPNIGYLYSLLVFIAFLPSVSHASHLMGGDLTYVNLGGNTYRIKLTLYRDCSGVAMNPSEVIAISSTNCAVSTFANASLEAGYPVEVSVICNSGATTCNGGTALGVEEYVYSTIYTLPSACTDWTFSYTNCCRNYSITTGSAGEAFYFEAILNNVAAPQNSSPDFYTKPVPVFGVNQAQNYSHATSEQDGDNLVYSVVTPRQNVGTPVTYNAPWSPSYPISTSSGSFTINSVTGQMQFTPTQIQISVTAVLVQEYRNGVFVGSVMRDIQLIISNGLTGGVAIGGINNLSGATLNAGQTHAMTACSGVPVTFQIQASSTTGNPVVTDNASVSLPGGATLSYSGTNPVMMTFTWTPPATAVGYNAFYIYARDNFCPIPSVANANIVIYVAGVEAIASSDTICAGQQIQLNTTIFGNPSGIYTWSGSGLSATNIKNPTAVPATLPQIYTVSYTYAGCVSSDNITIFKGGSINASPPVSNVCTGQTVQLTTNAVMPFMASGASCGISTRACVGTSTNYTIGTGASTIQYPFCGYWHDGRTQFLYTAAELTAAGLSVGNINALALNVITKNSTIPYNNFNIKLGCTNLSTLNNFVGGMTTVYAPISGISTTTGWNHFDFDNSFFWNGTNNLVVEICFDNTTYSQYDHIAYTTTSANSAFFRYQDNVVGCALTSGIASTSRANILFNHCSVSPPVAYTWSPPTGLSASNIPNPIATAGPGNIAYAVEAAGGGCVLRDTLQLRTSNLVDATPDSSGICSNPGLTVNLNTTTFITAITTPPPCGATNAACGGATVDYIFGNPNTTVTYPFTGLMEDGKLQMLYRGTELSALGMGAGGKINAIALNIQSVNSTIPYSNFTISIGCTNLTILNTFQSGLTTVYSGSYTLSGGAGWKTIPFTNGYAWDGTTNLIVQICFDNTSSSNNDFIYASNTSFISTIHSATDGASGCGLLTGTATNMRPNVRFFMCSLNAPVSYQWSPTTDLSNPNIANPVATPSATRTYTVTVSNGVCTAADAVKITVDNCVLPADALSLTASVSKNEDYFVIVDWVTHIEQLTDLYEVQRKYPDEPEFLSIASVEALGIMGDTHYQHFDKTLRPVYGEEKIFYRIKEIDTDGNTFYSEAIEVKIMPNVETLNFEVYPNPTAGKLTLTLQNNQTDIKTLKITIMDNTGRVTSFVPENVFNRTLTLDVSSLPTGTYFLSAISSDGKRSYRKFVKAE